MNFIISLQIYIFRFILLLFNVQNNILDSKNTSISTNKTDPSYNFNHNHRRKSADRNRSFDMQHSRGRNNTYHQQNPSRFTQDQGFYFQNMNPSGFGGMPNSMSSYGNNPHGMGDQPILLNPGNSKNLFNYLFVICNF